MVSERETSDLEILTALRISMFMHIADEIANRYGSRCICLICFDCLDRY